MNSNLIKARAAKLKKLTSPETYQSNAPLELQYKRLAHTANLRMDKLRELSKESGFQGVTKMSMAKLQHSARVRGFLTESGRLSEAIPKINGNINQSELKIRIKELQYFLTRPTSTKTGIIEINQKKADTINERYGTDFTWQDIETYFESGFAEKADSKYGSKTALRALGVIQKNKDTVRKQMQQHRKKVVIADDSQLQKSVDKALKDKGLTRLGLY